MSIDYTNYIKPVSIHATLAGGDARLGRCMLTSVCFYPRHPRGWRLSSALPSGTASGFYPRHPRGWRQTSFGLAAPTPLFLSTPPSRVATWRYNLFADRDSGFYPRHPRGWRLQNRVVETLNAYVSIHATLAGGDSGSSQRTYRQKEFLSTPPSRVATCRRWCVSSGRFCFYPRHPRGWRPQRFT